jgi:hypothetical protein
MITLLLAAADSGTSAGSLILLVAVALAAYVIGRAGWPFRACSKCDGAGRFRSRPAERCATASSAVAAAPSAAPTGASGTTSAIPATDPADPIPRLLVEVAENPLSPQAITGWCWRTAAKQSTGTTQADPQGGFHNVPNPARGGDLPRHPVPADQRPDPAQPA